MQRPDYCDEAVGKEDHSFEKDDVYSALIDLDNTYDKVWREDLSRILAKYGVSGRLQRAMNVLLENSKSKVRVEEEVLECFDVQQGVRQGHHLSPWFFNIFLDMVA